LSHLSNVGLTETLAPDRDHYVEVAIGLTRQLEIEKLATSRRELRERMLKSPLCDGRRFALNLLKLLLGVAVSTDSRSNHPRTVHASRARAIFLCLSAVIISFSDLAAKRVQMRKRVFFQNLFDFSLATIRLPPETRVRNSSCADLDRKRARPPPAKDAGHCSACSEQPTLWGHDDVPHHAASAGRTSAQRGLGV
jgi:hypothetical protein